jgi:hypothetical protein
MSSSSGPAGSTSSRTCPRRRVLGAEALGDRRLSHRQAPARRRVAKYPRGVENDGDVDELLEKRSPCRGQVTGGGDEHRHERKTDADHHAFQGDQPGATDDDNRLTEATPSATAEAKSAVFSLNVLTDNDDPSRAPVHPRSPPSGLRIHQPHSRRLRRADLTSPASVMGPPVRRPVQWDHLSVSSAWAS